MNKRDKKNKRQNYKKNVSNKIEETQIKKSTLQIYP